MDRRVKSRLLIVPFVAWLLFFILGPSIFIALMSLAHRSPFGTVEMGGPSTFSLEAYKTLFDPLYGKILLHTLFFAASNALLCLCLAFPLSFFIVRLKKSKRLWVLTLVLVPFWTSFLVRTLAFMDVLRLKPFGMDWIYTAKGILGAMVYNYLPFAVLPIYSSMEKIDPLLLEAANDLGASRWQVFRKLLLPLTKSGVIAALLFVFIPSLGEFLIPDLIGGSHYFLLGSFLQNQFLTARNWPLGSAAIVLLTVVTLAILVFLLRSDDQDNSQSQDAKTLNTAGDAAAGESMEKGPEPVGGGAPRENNSPQSRVPVKPETVPT